VKKREQAYFTPIPGAFVYLLSGLRAPARL
jgi:hypothetical protein